MPAAALLVVTCKPEEAQLNFPLQAERGARNGFIYKHAAAWVASPAARTARHPQYLTALANESSSDLQAHIQVHPTEREQFNSSHYSILLILRMIAIVLLSANLKNSRQVIM